VFTDVNHPVHIVTRDNKLSPSALIPFCDFGGNMSAMGVKIDQFDSPVCNSFQAKIQNDQLCYEVDLHKFVNEKKIDVDMGLKEGFRFLLDYNEDRQVGTVNEKPLRKKDSEWFNKFNPNAEVDKDQHAFIYLDTIGKRLSIILKLFSSHIHNIY